MDEKTYKRKNKLSAIVKDNKGIEDRALLLIMLSVLLFVVIGIIMGALSSIGGTVERAGKAANDTIDKYAERFTKDPETTPAAK
jgi:hypothetical protein